MKRLKFGKEQRLLARKDFLKCYDGGKRHFTASFIFFVLPTEADSWRIGLAVSKKIGRAVQRNRVKRLLREFFRLNQELIPGGVDLVIVPKKHLQVKELGYQSLSKELLSLLNGLSENMGRHKLQPAGEKGN